MTPLEAAQGRHYLTERHKGFRLCAACLMSWPCDFQVQREEAFKLGAEVELLAEMLGQEHDIAVSNTAIEDHYGEARKARGYCSVCDALAAFEDVT